MQLVNYIEDLVFQQQLKSYKNLYQLLKPVMLLGIWLYFNCLFILITYFYVCRGPSGVRAQVIYDINTEKFQSLYSTKFYLRLWISMEI